MGKGGWMADYRDEFGAAIRAVMDDQGREISTREVSKRSRGKISPTTVLAMRDGKVPGPELVVAFAQATGMDPNELLDKAGIWHLRFVPDREHAGSVRRPLMPSLQTAGVRV